MKQLGTADQEVLIVATETGFAIREDGSPPRVPACIPASMTLTNGIAILLDRMPETRLGKTQHQHTTSLTQPVSE